MIEDGKSIAGIAWPKQSICALRVKESLRGASFPHCADVTVASRWFFFRFSDKPCAQKAMKSHLWSTLSAHRLKKPNSWPHKFGAFLRIFEQTGLSEVSNSWTLSLPWRLGGTWMIQFSVRTTCRDAFPKYMQVREAPAFPTGDKRPCLEFAAEITAGWQYRTMRIVNSVAQALTTSAKHWQCDE